MSNTKNEKPTRLSNASASGVTRPQWVTSVASGLGSGSQSSGRKLYVLLALWAVVLTVAMAAVGTGMRDDEGTPITQSVPEAFVKPIDSLSDGSAAQAGRHLQIDAEKLNDALPSVFRNTQPNVITNSEHLKPIASMLLSQERPLRVLHLGDSHVAGKSFPQAVKGVLTEQFGSAESADEGSGVWFNFIGSNGATSSRFLTGNYMQRIADLRPDLIILSLGTNEAHGMGYREAAHTEQLNTFFERLNTACPNAVILLTTPPGDYLTTTYVNYRRTSRHSRKKVRQVRRSTRPNPMSVRCAANIMAYGAEHDMAVWDMHSICGGSLAERNWVSAHLMRPDRIHFQPDGYALQGRLLGNALVRTLAEMEL